MSELIGKNEFPLLAQNPNLVYLDSAATTQKPKAVLDRLLKYYTYENANVHRGIYDLAETATRAYNLSRARVARFINAREDTEIVFTANATMAINLVKSAWAAKFLQKGDRILLTVMEHHSNLLPWLNLKEILGVEIDLIPLREDFTLDMDAYKKLLQDGPKLVAITHMSNVLGEIVPIEEMIKAAKTVGATVLVDACQSVARMKIDVQTWDCDFLVFSGHKIYGPTGVGVLYGKREVLQKMDPFMYGGGMVAQVDWEGESMWKDAPEKFEAGTPNIAGVVGLHAAIDFVDSLGMEQILEHDRKLTEYALDKLTALDYVKVYGNGPIISRGGAIAFGVDGVHPHDLAQFVSDNANVCLRAGQHCCQPLMETLDAQAVARMSFGVYTDEADIDKAINAIMAAWKFWV